MSYLDRIETCNRYDLSAYRPFVVDGFTVGWVSETFWDVLAISMSTFELNEKSIGFAASYSTSELRSDAIAEACRQWLTDRHVPKLRNEIYPVKQTWSDPELFRLDRGLVPFFGVKAYGVHLNGFVRRKDGFHLWVGRRNKNSHVAPGKLDNIVAGGQPSGISIIDNLIKECDEEASIPERLARQAISVGAVSYCFGGDDGLQADTLFCFDLEVPDDFEPVNQDGEVTAFKLMPLREALALIEQGESFKFNVSLVILDFAIRRGALTPDTDSDFEAILAGLHAPFPSLKAQ